MMKMVKRKRRSVVKLIILVRGRSGLAWAMGLRDRLGIMPGTWRKIRDEITRHKGRIDFVWVPSHGK